MSSIGPSGPLDSSNSPLPTPPKNPRSKDSIFLILTDHLKRSIQTVFSFAKQMLSTTYDHVTTALRAWNFSSKNSTSNELNDTELRTFSVARNTLQPNISAKVAIDSLIKHAKGEYLSNKSSISSYFKVLNLPEPIPCNRVTIAKTLLSNQDHPNLKSANTQTLNPKLIAKEMVKDWGKKEGLLGTLPENPFSHATLQTKLNLNQQSILLATDYINFSDLGMESENAPLTQEINYKGSHISPNYLVAYHLLQDELSNSHTLPDPQIYPKIYEELGLNPSIIAQATNLQDQAKEILIQIFSEENHPANTPEIKAKLIELSKLSTPLANSPFSKITEKSKDGDIAKELIVRGFVENSPISLDNTRLYRLAGFHIMSANASELQEIAKNLAKAVASTIEAPPNMSYEVSEDGKIKVSDERQKYNEKYQAVIETFQNLFIAAGVSVTNLSLEGVRMANLSSKFN